MEAIAAGLETAVGWVWGTWLVTALVISGIFLTVRLRFPQFRGFKHAVQIVAGRFDKDSEPGEITHFQALSAALSATVGLGNIAGVAIAISTGGPGAIVWMWLIGFFGMATKATSCTLSVKYRHFAPDGSVLGGPMHYIEMGLGPKWKPVAALFAFLVAVAAFGGGNMFQSNQVAAALGQNLGVPAAGTGIALAVGVGLVIIGGIKRIGRVAASIVPAMCAVYVLGALVVIAMHLPEIPAAFGLIFSDAVTGNAMAGGAVGEVIRQGVRRGTFSNESGLGSAPIAHAAARTDEPAREGLVALLEPFIDTLVVCTMTALVIIFTGVYQDAATIGGGVELTTAAFDSVLAGFGSYFVSIAVGLFAFSTMISWSYYGEQGAEYLFGPRAVLPYKLVFVGLIFVGAVWNLGPVVNFSDMAFGLMAVPNVLALWLLSGDVRREHDDYFARYGS